MKALFLTLSIVFFFPALATIFEGNYAKGAIGIVFSGVWLSWYIILKNGKEVKQ